MELNDFLENFADQFEDFDPSEITPTSEFKNFNEWSSLTALSIIAMVDEEYDVQLKGDDVRNARTVQDLFELVKSRK